MNKYLVEDQQGHKHTPIEAESMLRDGDWIMLTKAAPVMESRRIDKGEPEGIVNVMVSTGRVTQQPVAYFYKPTSVLLVSSEEPSNGDDA